MVNMFSRGFSTLSNSHHHRSSVFVFQVAIMTRRTHTHTRTPAISGFGKWKRKGERAAHMSTDWHLLAVRLLPLTHQWITHTTNSTGASFASGLQLQHSEYMCVWVCGNSFVFDFVKNLPFLNKLFRSYFGCLLRITDVKESLTLFGISAFQREKTERERETTKMWNGRAARKFCAHKRRRWNSITFAHYDAQSYAIMLFATFSTRINSECGVLPR